jgi:hypothetical protein
MMISLAFYHLAISDEAEVEYQAWPQDAPMLDPAFRQLVIVNQDDEHLCVNRISPSFRASKATVDYFVAHVVFSKEMKKLRTSCQGQAGIQGSSE